ncbi:MAG: 50S ribosomal protein L9 [Clostridiales bacterium]|nr:50S ribosomal protein L9 [Clostridiales bacterium]
MKVLLEQDIKGTGKKGEIVDVAEGYARNFLLPRKMASPADAASINAMNIQKSAAQHRKFQAGIAARDAAKALDRAQVTIQANVGENGKMFGTVGNKEVAAALKVQKGVDVDKKNIRMDPVRAIGEYSARIALFEGVSAVVTVRVIAK